MESSGQWVQGVHMGIICRFSVSLRSYHRIKRGNEMLFSTCVGSLCQGHFVIPNYCFKRMIILYNNSLVIGLVIWK
jgi:hypothetical protein